MIPTMQLPIWKHTGIILILLLFGILVLAYFLVTPKTATISQPTLPVFHQATPAYPGQIIDLADWKITLPVASSTDQSTPLEIKQPELATYSLPPLFTTTPDGQGVIFRAPVNGITTSGSSYPRTELREMSDNGKNEAFWPSTTGTHTLFIDEAITAVPKNKPVVVAGQIHGDTDDLLVIRLEYPKLYLSRNKANLYTLDENYTLGKRFTIKFVASDGEVMVYYNNSAAPIYTLQKKVNQAYFKVGVYTQSSCATEISPDLCNSNNYGEVAVYKATLSHQ